MSYVWGQGSQCTYVYRPHRIQVSTQQDHCIHHIWLCGFKSFFMGPFLVEEQHPNIVGKCAFASKQNDNTPTLFTTSSEQIR